MAMLDAFFVPQKFAVAVLFVLTLIAFPRPAPAAGEPQPWHLPDWQYRQTVEMIRPDADRRINTGLIELMAEPGQFAPDGRDVRILDEAGDPVKFQFVSETHEPIKGDLPAGQPIRLHFEVSKSPGRFYYVYFGNPNAEKLPSVEWTKTLSGLTLETRINSARRNAQNWEDMTRVISVSKWKFGEGPRRQINDTENPFGPNEQFISIYRGLIYCPSDGMYTFGTDSDDSSFLLIDGTLVAEWPGGHTEAGSFEHSGNIELKAGSHRIEYYHVQTTGGSLARAGWRVPGGEDIITIPEHAFLRELRTETQALESRDNPISAFFNVNIMSSFQFGTEGPSFGEVYFRDMSQSRSGEVRVREWDLGDGSVSVETSPRHLYDGGHTYKVTLRVTDELGYENSFTRTVTVPASASQRIHCDLEVTPKTALLLPDEPLDVIVKTRGSAGLTVPLDMVVSVQNSNGEDNIKREQARLSATDWSESTLQVLDEKQGEPAFGTVHFKLEFRGVPVLTQSVRVVQAVDDALKLVAGSAQLTDDEGLPIVLRLSNHSLGRNLEGVKAALKGNGTVRIVVLDDSLAGALPGGYPSILKSRLEKNFTRTAFTVRRVGPENNAKAYQPMAGLVDLSQNVGDADLVILAASLRDILRFTSVEQFERMLQTLVERVAAESKAPILLIAPPPMIANPGMGQAYAMAVKRVAMRLELPVADAYSAFMRASTEGSDWRELYRDPESDLPVYHVAPMAKGQQLVADILYHAILTD